MIAAVAGDGRAPEYHRTVAEAIQAAQAADAGQPAKEALMGQAIGGSLPLAVGSALSPVATLGLAAVLAGANPKNLLLAVGGAAAIAQTAISAGQQAIAYLVFALIGTLGVGIPVGIYFAMGARSEKLLAGLKDWMTAHNAVIMTVLCLVIAAKLIGDGISGLAG